MYVDASPQCNTLDFLLGSSGLAAAHASTITPRQWNIKVQFNKKFLQPYQFHPSFYYYFYYRLHNTHAIITIWHLRDAHSIILVLQPTPSCHSTLQVENSLLIKIRTFASGHIKNILYIFNMCNTKDP